MTRRTGNAAARIRRLGICGLLLVIAWSSRAEETIRLIPQGSRHWSVKNVFAPVTSIFLGPNYWYGERELRVETTPPGAVLDLFYVRNGFQKRYEQALAPATVILPKRIDANPRDVVKVRAFLEGYSFAEEAIRVSSREKFLQIELSPLPNVLRAVSYTYFAGRGALSFLTDESLGVSIQKRPDGFSVALTQTATSEHLANSLEGIRSPDISEVEAHQLGEDLLVSVRYQEAALQDPPELRSREAYDAVRELHVYTVDLVGDRTAAVERARSALARIRSGDVSGCAAQFDDTLRSELPSAGLSRALAPRGEFTDPFLRAAMKRLGEVSTGGVIRLQDGTQYEPSASIQLSAAINQASEAKGFLALLRRMVELLEPAPYRQSVLRSVIAPELSPSAFAKIIARAERAERRCAGQTAER